MVTLEYNRLSNNAIQRACDVLKRWSIPPLNIRIINTDSSCCFSQFDLLHPEEKRKVLQAAYDDFIDTLIEFYDNNEPNSNTVEFFFNKFTLESFSSSQNEYNGVQSSSVRSFINEIKDQNEVNFNEKIEISQNNTNHEFIAKIENEIISSVHLGVLFALLTRVAKIVLSNCILTFNMNNNFELLKSSLFSKTKYLILNNWTYREFCYDWESENNIINFKVFKPKKEECSKNLNNFLIQTNQIDTLNSIDIVDQTRKQYLWLFKMIINFNI